MNQVVINMLFIDRLSSDISRIGLTGTEGIVFAVLYLATVIPCWVLLYLFLRNFKNRKLKRSVVFGFLLFILLALPYTYAFFALNTAPWQLGVALLIILAYTFYKLIFKTAFFSVWDLYAKYYDVLLNLVPYKELVNDISQKIIKYKNEGKILEVGMGTGNILSSISNKGNFEIHGIERSESMIGVAQKKLKNVEVYKFDLNSNDFRELPKYFDVIVINNVLYSIDKPYEIITKLLGKMRPGGIILISEPHDKSSIFGIIKHHFRARGIFFSTIDFFRYFFPYLYVYCLNVYISAKKGARRYTFFSAQDLLSFMKRNNCEILESGLCYGKENIFLVAKNK